MLQVAAQLYQIQGRYDLALAIYLRQQQPAVFDFIQEHHLLPVLHERVAQLLSIDEERATQLLMDQYDEVPASTVVPSIQVSEGQLPCLVLQLHLLLKACSLASVLHLACCFAVAVVWMVYFSAKLLGNSVKRWLRVLSLHSKAELTACVCAHACLSLSVFVSVSLSVCLPVSVHCTIASISEDVHVRPCVRCVLLCWHM